MTLMQKTIANIEKEGLISTAGRSKRYVERSVKNYFKVSRPIEKELKKSCDGLIVKKIQGSKMILNLSDMGISRELFLTGIHEGNSTQQLKKEIKPGMTIVEVGANIGYYTLIESRLIGPSGHIFAFEPSPVNMRMLKMNVLLNEIEPIIEMHEVGIGARSGKETFFMTNKGNTSSFIKRDDQNGVETLKEIPMSIISLDDFFADKDVKIGFVRMDVEGYELEVIEGMQKLLNSTKAPYGFFIEVHSELLHRRNSSARSFLETFKKFGYEIKKSFYRGRSDISADSMESLLNHDMLEKGYWETFFYKRP